MLVLKCRGSVTMLSWFYTILMLACCMRPNEAHDGYHYPRPAQPLALPTASVAAQWLGYMYPQPNRIATLVERNATNAASEPLAEQPPAGVMGDFIEDLIEDHKQQIVASILGHSDAVVSSSSAAGSVDPALTGDNKAFVANRCAICTCGVPNINRIIGGKQVRYNKYPWIVQMLLGGDQLFCGGALINDRYILTAAHCVHGMNMQSVTVRLLQVDRSAELDAGITRTIMYALMHSGYNPVTLVHDIALLRLNDIVPLLDPIRPVCLPSNMKQNFDFQMGVVAGWGLTQEDGSTSSTLQEAKVPIITNAQCKATSYMDMIVDTMLCAGYVGKGGRDACQGDSGGPLIVKQRIFRIAGVVSYGYGCARPESPGVYTRVSRYLPWISTNTRDACYCTS